jgi:hypothetical protein
MADLQHVHAEGFGYGVRQFDCNTDASARYFSNAAYYARQTRMACGCTCGRGLGKRGSALTKATSDFIALDGTSHRTQFLMPR